MKTTRHKTLPFDAASSRNDRLGAVIGDGGTNFAVFSENAERVDLCLFDDSGKTETARMPMPEMQGGIWYGFVPGVGHGQVYGYRVHGRYAPEEGHRFNPNKLLLDPYARELHGSMNWDDALFGYTMGKDDLSYDTRDSAPHTVKGVVVGDSYQWDQSNALRTRWRSTVIYEAHVKGLTMRHPYVDETLRGTFEGLASDAVIAHLHRIGVTAIELLPVQAFTNDKFLTDKGLSNYWGYNTLSFFAPQSAYLHTGHVAEVQHAVDRFHRAGIEVILDVVYNHTCEGNENGPTLSFRGLDNAAYYLLSPDDPRHSFDTTGTGNTLNVAHPMVLRMVLDSLRYWVEVMHVDGFRFDLASTLGRESDGFERDGAFFAAIRQDPVLSGVKLIAEPWDVGDGGYQVGGFPWPFREWNDKARDDVRGFWRKDPGLLPRLSQRLTGSPVQFDHSNRPATSSINLVAAHDGFTLWDTLSYNEKHNDANGEDGNDGHGHNLSDNMGVEGATDDPDIEAARLRRAKAMLATLILSQGTPMILAGDEFGQSQEGNNNAYCQDNDVAWLDWAGARPALVDAVAALTALRQGAVGFWSPVFGSTEPAEGQRHCIDWHHPDGHAMAEDDWNDPDLRAVGMRITAADGAALLILVNAGDDCDFALPGDGWSLRLDTAREADIACDEPVAGSVALGWQSVQVMKLGVSA